MARIAWIEAADGRQPEVRRSPHDAAASGRIAVFASILLGATVTLFCLRLAGTGLAANRDDPRPNFVLIVSDDQRWDTVGSMPTLSQLPARNIVNGYVTTPLCCPSRASILTGQYAHHHGVLTNSAPRGGFGRFEDGDTLSTWLHEAGYRTMLVGKYLNGYEPRAPTYVPPGWDDWFAILVLPSEEDRLAGPLEADFDYYNYWINNNGGIQAFGSSEDDYSTDVLMRRAEQAIRTNDGRPFFLYLAPTAPHIPARPAPRHAAQFSDLPPWRPPSFDEEDVSDKPPWIAHSPRLGDDWQTRIDQFRRRQLAALQAVDEGLGRVLVALRDTGQVEKTVIIYISDNSVTWGEHRIPWHKDCPYQECVRVPLLISYPPLTPGRVEDERIALNIDLAPTIVELAGLAPPRSVDGVSLLPLVDGSATGWRTDFLVEGWSVDLPRGMPDFAGVRSARWSYVEYETGHKELYDLRSDPFELVNIAGRPPYPTEARPLAARLAELKEQGGVRPAPEPGDEPEEQTEPGG